MSSIKPKTGLCPECADGVTKPLIGKLCAAVHYWPSRRKQATPKPRTPIKPVSDKQAKLNRIYGVAATKFKEDHPVCQVEGCILAATDVHHKAGRIGEKLLDQRTWLAVCRAHHLQIESNPEWAKKNGYSENRLT